MMMNGPMIKEATSDQVVMGLIKIGRSPGDAVDYMYMSALARKPSPAEIGMVTSVMSTRGDGHRRLSRMFGGLS